MLTLGRGEHLPWGGVTAEWERLRWFEGCRRFGLSVEGVDGGGVRTEDGGVTLSCPPDIGGRGGEFRGCFEERSSGGC